MDSIQFFVVAPRARLPQYPAPCFVLEQDNWNDFGFPRIVNVAFSPFDSFMFPTTDERNRGQLVKEMQSGTGRYTFIGLRDIAAEEQAAASAPNVPISPVGEPSAVERQVMNRLKPMEQLADEFAAFSTRINHEPNRLQTLQVALFKLGTDVADRSLTPGRSVRGSWSSGSMRRRRRSAPASTFRSCLPMRRECAAPLALSVRCEAPMQPPSDIVMLRWPRP